MSTYSSDGWFSAVLDAGQLSVDVTSQQTWLQLSPTQYIHSLLIAELLPSEIQLTIILFHVSSEHWHYWLGDIWLQTSRPSERPLKVLWGIFGRSGLMQSDLVNHKQKLQTMEVAVFW